MRNRIPVALLILTMLFLLVWESRGQTDNPRNIIYLYQVIDDPTQTGNMDAGMKKLNELGAQGWELAGVSRGENSPAKLYLKRRVL